MIGVLEALCTVAALILPLLATNLTELAWLATVALLCHITAAIGGLVATWMYIGVIGKLIEILPGR